MTTITPLPPAPDRRDPSTFAAKADPFVNALPTMVTETNTVIGEINTAASNASTSASTASTKANEALDSAELAESWATSLTEVSGGLYGARKYAQDAAGAVATLPDGVINNATVSATDTWSSSKINTELGNKQDKITASGIIKGDGSGGVSAAVAGVDYQAPLVSGTTIKTINDQSVLGDGNITIGGVTGNGVSADAALIVTARGEITVPSVSNSALGLSTPVKIDSDRTLLLVSANGFLASVVYSKSQGFGSTAVIRASGNFSTTGGDAVATLIDSTRVLVASCPSAATNFQAAVLSISNLTITVNTPTALTLPTATPTPSWGNPNNGYTGVLVSGAFVIGYSGAYLIAMTVSGTAVSAASTASNLLSTSTGNPILHTNGNGVGYVFSTATANKACAFTVSGTSVTGYTAVDTVSGLQVSATRMTNGVNAPFIVTAGSLVAVAVIPSGTSLSLSNVVSLNLGGVSGIVKITAKISDQAVVCVSEYWSYPYYNLSGLAVKLTGSTLSTAYLLTISNTGNNSARAVGNLGIRDGKLFISYSQTTQNRAIASLSMPASTLVLSVEKSYNNRELGIDSKNLWDGRSALSVTGQCDATVLLGETINTSLVLHTDTSYAAPHTLIAVSDSGIHTITNLPAPNIYLSTIKESDSEIWECSRYSDTVYFLQRFQAI